MTVVGILAGVVSYSLAKSDANSLLDQQMRLVARTLDEGSQLDAMQAGFRKERAAEAERDFVMQVWYKDKPVRTSRPDFYLREANSPGFSDLQGNNGIWRAYTIIYPDRTVQVSQSEEVRSAIAANAALRALIPVAGLIPLSWLLVVFGVRYLLKPLDTVTNAATARDASSLDPLPTDGVPDEVYPLIVEINALLGRLKDALESQRQFVFNAAHELRTPLTAMQLQIENLAQNQSFEETRQRFGELISGVQRASHLVSQLLKMARFEAQNDSVQAEVDLGEIVKSCIADFIPFAERRHVDLGMLRDEQAKVNSNAEDLRILFNNLLDNAIRYIPENGKIDVSVFIEDNKAVVKIADNGPGIPDHLLPRIFDRFFRASGQDTEGSGIGLSIVKAIAERESAEIILRNRPEGSGLVARISLPLLLPACLPVTGQPEPSAT